MPPKPVAKIEGEYLKVKLADNPGCLDRAEAWLRRVVGYVAVAGLGFLAGVWYGLMW